jgi:hypothetical protein
MGSHLLLHPNTKRPLNSEPVTKSEAYEVQKQQAETALDKAEPKYPTHQDQFYRYFEKRQGREDGFPHSRE